MNTGKKIVLRLKEVSNPGGTPTGNTKANVPGDADYIAPYQDLAACPVGSGSLLCPAVVLTDSAGVSLLYEFSMSSAAIANTAIGKVKVQVLSGSTEVAAEVFTRPFGNYFSGAFAKPGSGTYTLQVRYLNNIDIELAACPALATVVIP